tara:strand:- start:76 stop:1116 length:1041 start_codon:yes stop_codon:yes gene_type:complete
MAARIGNWIDRQQKRVEDIGQAAVDQLKGVRIAPNSRAIRAMHEAQKLKKLAGIYLPNVEEGIDDIIGKADEFLGRKLKAKRFDPPPIIHQMGVQNGPVFSSKFVVNIPKPPVASIDTNWFYQFGSTIKNPEKDFKFVIQSASLPSTNISTNAVESPGPEVLMPYQIAFDDITLEVICTVGDLMGQTGLPEKRFFDAWMANVIDPYSMEIGYREDYIIPEMEILVFGNHDLKAPIMVIVLENSYPISMDAVDLGHDNNDIVKINVNLHFEKWRYQSDVTSKLKLTEASQPIKTQEISNHIKIRDDVYSYVDNQITRIENYAKDNLPIEKINSGIRNFKETINLFRE